MLPCFPDPYPDEILYSVWARFSSRVQYPHKQEVFQELFGKRSVGSAMDLPCHLGYVIDNLPVGHKYTVDDLIDYHTLFPFYGPFLSQDRWQSLREQMIQGSGTAIHRRLGFATYSIPRTAFFRYCPDCSEQDKKVFGEYYWHRLHQVPGVEICPVHGNFLEESKIPTGIAWSDSIFISANDGVNINVSQKALSSPWYQILQKIANDTSYLLEHPCKPLGLSFLHETYLALLATHNLTTIGGFVRVIDLLNIFANYYPSGLLNKLHCDIGQSNNLYNTWLSRLMRSSNLAQHPLHHILAIRLLDSSIENFFHQSIKSPKPFEEGPWPCLNRVCEYYKKRSISSCQIKESHGKGIFTGIFTCSCGFSYSRSKAISSPDNVFRRDKILSYGTIWQQKLRELWFIQNLSLSSISNILGVSSRHVNRQATKLGLPVPRNPYYLDKVGVTRKLKTQKDVSWYRTQWFTIMEENPNESIFSLSYKFPGIFGWLRDNDRQWFLENRPPVRSVRRVPAHIHQNLQLPNAAIINSYDETYDFYLAELVRNSAYKIETLCPPQRVTIHAIEKSHPHIRAAKYKINKLPLTSDALQEVKETHEFFVIRRIWWCVRKYQEEQIIPTRAQFIQRISLQHSLSIPAIQSNLESALAVLSNVT